MAKVIIHLRDYELTALNNLAQHEYRAPKAQAVLIIRRELHKLGMPLSELPVQIHQGNTQPGMDGSPETEAG